MIKRNSYIYKISIVIGFLILIVFVLGIYSRFLQVQYKNYYTQVDFYRIADLNTMVDSVDFYYFENKTVPPFLTELNYGAVTSSLPTETTYTPLSSSTYRICTAFKKSSRAKYINPCNLTPDGTNPFDIHQAGKQCFDLPARDRIPFEVLCGNNILTNLEPYFAWTDPILKLFVK